MTYQNNKEKIPRLAAGPKGKHGIAARAGCKNFEPEYRPDKNNAPAAMLGAIPPSRMKHLRRDAVWRGNDLIFGRRKVASIVSDLIRPGMWRVRIGGRVTDMVNRARARDAALSLAGGVLP
jgi:hypothetical protein